MPFEVTNEVTAFFKNQNFFAQIVQFYSQRVSGPKYYEQSQKMEFGVFELSTGIFLAQTGLLKL